MTDMIEFLRSRLDEDEATARAAMLGPWRFSPQREWVDPVRPLHREEAVFAGEPGKGAITVCLTGPSDDLQSQADAAHIARWDPARVLAEVAAKREILDMHEGGYHDCPERSPLLGIVTSGWVEEGPCSTVLALIQPYADHPDFNPSWKL